MREINIIIPPLKSLAGDNLMREIIYSIHG